MQKKKSLDAPSARVNMTKNDHLHTFFQPFSMFNLFVYILKVKIQKIVCKIGYQNGQKQKISPIKA